MEDKDDELGFTRPCRSDVELCKEPENTNSASYSKSVSFTSTCSIPPSMPERRLLGSANIQTNDSCMFEGKTGSERFGPCQIRNPMSAPNTDKRMNKGIGLHLIAQQRIRSHISSSSLSSDHLFCRVLLDSKEITPLPRFVQLEFFADGGDVLLSIIDPLQSCDGTCQPRTYTLKMDKLVQNSFFCDGVIHKRSSNSSRSMQINFVLLDGVGVGLHGSIVFKVLETRGVTSQQFNSTSLSFVSFPDYEVEVSSVEVPLATDVSNELTAVLAVPARNRFIIGDSSGFVHECDYKLKLMDSQLLSHDIGGIQGFVEVTGYRPLFYTKFQIGIVSKFPQSSVCVRFSETIKSVEAILWRTKSRGHDIRSIVIFESGSVRLYAFGVEQSPMQHCSLIYDVPVLLSPNNDAVLASFIQENSFAVAFERNEEENGMLTMHTEIQIFSCPDNEQLRRDKLRYIRSISYFFSAHLDNVESIRNKIPKGLKVVQPSECDVPKLFLTMQDTQCPDFSFVQSYAVSSKESVKLCINTKSNATKMLDKYLSKSLSIFHGIPLLLPVVCIWYMTKKYFFSSSHSTNR